MTILCDDCGPARAVIAYAEEIRTTYNRLVEEHEDLRTYCKLLQCTVTMKDELFEDAVGNLKFEMHLFTVLPRTLIMPLFNAPGFRFGLDRWTDTAAQIYERYKPLEEDWKAFLKHRNTKRKVVPFLIPKHRREP
jgi:hypothetical protein